jgi:hypothetical protein
MTPEERERLSRRLTEINSELNALQQAFEGLRLPHKYHQLCQDRDAIEKALQGDTTEAP